MVERYTIWGGSYKQEGSYIDVDLGEMNGKFNFVSSAYGRTVKNLITYAVNENQVLYQSPDENKVKQLLTRNGLQLPTPLFS